MKTFAFNKRAIFDYHLLEKFEGGLILLGHEVKSVKTGHISLKGAYVTLKNNCLWLTNANIPLYKMAGNIESYDPERPRELLLNKNEISRIMGKMSGEALTLIPVRVYTKKGKIKLGFALARGKKKYDKREDNKRRDAQRNIQRELKNY